MDSIEKLETTSEDINRETDELSELIDTLKEFTVNVKVAKQDIFYNIIKQLKIIKSNFATYADNAYCLFETIAAEIKPKADDSEILRDLLKEYVKDYSEKMYIKNRYNIDIIY